MNWRQNFWRDDRAPPQALPAGDAAPDRASDRTSDRAAAADRPPHRRTGRDAPALPPLLLTNPVTPPRAAAGGGAAPARADAGDDDCPYLDHFGLTARPFSLLPDPKFLFWSPTHKRAHAVLEYGLMSRAPLSLVTGEVGAGKTTLAHHFLQGLGASVRVGLISNASGLRGELLYWILSALGEAPSRQAEHAVLFDAFQRGLIDTYASGRRTLLIFDEAQTLGPARLEELRMLTNINTGTDVLLQVMLLGQPELRDIIRQPDMSQFAQRVAATFHLPTMTPDIQAAYIRHRLMIAGAPRPLFADAALELIYPATRGIPRLTNQLCDLAMLYAYSAHKLVVDADCVQNVLDDDVLIGAGARTGCDSSATSDQM